MELNSESLSTRLVEIITKTVNANNESALQYEAALTEASDRDGDGVGVNLEGTERHATLLFSDIDGTLKVSHGTGAVSVVPLEVRRAVARINGIAGAVFFIPATGRDIELADGALPGLRLATIADDGGYVRGIDGRSTLHPLPEIPEFRELGASIIELGHAKQLKLGNAYGLSYPLQSKVYDEHVSKFENLAEPRSDVIVYTHTYPDSKEIIVQDGLHTKGTAVLEIVQEFKNNAGFHHVNVFSVGDSSNDETHFNAVKQLGGFSVRVKPNGDTAAQFSVPTIDVFQDALVRTGQSLVELGLCLDDSCDELPDCVDDDYAD